MQDMFIEDFLRYHHVVNKIASSDLDEGMKILLTELIVKKFEKDISE